MQFGGGFFAVESQALPTTGSKHLPHMWAPPTASLVRGPVGPNAARREPHFVYRGMLHPSLFCGGAVWTLKAFGCHNLAP